MQINQYKDISFTTFDDIEKGKDAVYYGRLLYTKFLDVNSLIKFSLSGYNTIHKEKFMSNNYTEQLYSQNVYSAGIEYEYIFDNFSATLGASLDGTTTPHTGDKPSQPGKTDYSLNTALVYSIDQNISFQFNAGRKTRFPSLRETFSGALGRFVPNPGLKPEAITGGEMSINYLDKDVNAYASFFLNYTKNGIVRQSLPGKQFQRINKDEIRNLGIETKVGYKIDNDLSLNFNFTYLNSFAKNNSGGFTDTLEYQPKYIGGFNIDYTFLNKFNGIFEINYVGEEYGLQEGNTYFQQLPDYLLFNFRLAYNIKIARNVDSQIYVRVNNIFDKLYYTQWSLPEPGRQLWGGLSIDF
jgi:iron complex outermembrane receptor protein